MVYGETDDYTYNIIRDPVHIYDLNATALHLPGISHKQLTYRHQGRDYRLTNVHGNFGSDILAQAGMTLASKVAKRSHRARGIQEPHLEYSA